MRHALRRRRRIALLLLIALVATGLGVLLRSGHTLRRVEEQTVDSRFQIRGSRPHKADAAILVAIDNRTFNELRAQHLHSRPPLPRRYLARVIDRLHADGAKVIGLDFDLTHPNPDDPGGDNALVAAIGRARNVVIGTDRADHGRTAVLGGDAVLRRVHARAGLVTLFSDSDGTTRNMRYSALGLKNFGVVAAEVATGRPVPASAFGGQSRPVPIDYAGPAGTVRAVSYSRVLAGRFRPGTFTGKVVIVGGTDPSLQDLHPTSSTGAEPMPGAEINANMAATVLAGIPLRAPPRWVTVLLIALLALLVCVAGMRLGAVGVALTGIAILVLWSVATQLAFASGTLLDYADPAAALLLATAGAALALLWAERREHDRLRKLFAADAAGVVDDVLRPSGPRRLEPTAIIAGYRIDAVIGRGGMGVVYHATQLALDRPVALKLIATERAQDPVFRERFERESRLAAAIEHVNVIPVYEAGDDDGLLFIAMRFVEGTDLARVLAHEGQLEPARAAQLIGQLAGALDAAHARGLIHRDVKPANVLLTRDVPEHLYLTDFGVAKDLSVGDGVTNAGELVGTLDYLPPEQISGEAVGAAADIYALAAVLCHCLTGQVPFSRDNDAAKLWAHVNAAPPAPSALRAGLPPAIDLVIARGMAKDPLERYPSAAALAHACAHALGITSATGPRPDPDEVNDAPEPPPAAAPTVISE